MISTDSRTIKAHDIYVPLVGDKFDGHDFILDVLKKNAELIYSSRSWDNLLLNHSEEERNILLANEEKFVFVENTLETYQRLASEYREQLNPLVIAITGSNGKTTTKEMLASVLREHFKIHYSAANFNNEIGVPKTILEMPVDTQILILEMGMRGLGQIDLLSKIAKPNISIITNIGTAHIELLGSKENIKKAKLEIVNYAENYKGSLGEIKTTLILDDSLYADLEKQAFVNPNTGEHFKLNILTFSEQEQFTLNVITNKGINSDANAVFELAKLLGLSFQEVQEGLLTYKALGGRGTVYKDKHRNIFINDSYNASPESLLLSVEGVLKKFSRHEIFLVIGEILENDAMLIEKSVDAIKALCKQNLNSSLLDLRNVKSEDRLARFLEELNLTEVKDRSLEEITYEDLEELLEQDCKIVYLKASRGARLEGLLGI